MRFEPRNVFVLATPLKAGHGADGLPPDLAFLEPFGVPRAALMGAAARAAFEGTDGRSVLIAEGAVSEAFYYLALALHLDVPFEGAWPRLAAHRDASDALARGAVRLAEEEAGWLVAPDRAAIRALLGARSLGLAMPRITIAAPSHFAALVCHRHRERIARRASRALPDVAPRLSACGALPFLGMVALATGLFALIGGILAGSHLECDVLGVIFLAGIVFRLWACARGVARQTTDEAEPIPKQALPTYSILVPLHDEAEMVPPLVASLAALDYPCAKREVLFLIEPEDTATREALLAQRLPAGFRIVNLPPGAPRTKPRALNVGQLLARGELVTIYDAEDRPEPDQLRRAAARFADAPEILACLQARLAISNGAEGLLASLFAIEYAVLFDVFNAGLARLGLPIPLGGTSNHFRAAALRAVGGWDAWNVTEDADLGLRLARFGYAIDVLASTTFEEAPERFGLWLKQRRRWTKGWMQTLVVLARDLPDVVRDLGARRALVVALLLTNLVTGPLLTPVFLALVVWHLARDGVPAPHAIGGMLETLLAVMVIAVGGLGTLWQAWLGARRRGLRGWISLPAMLPYQLVIAAASWLGLYDLLRRPHHWHKTPHGAAARRRVRRPASAASPRA
jgi:glycosyltransferase XagB